MIWESAIGKLDGFCHHARDMERTLEEIALRRLCDRAIAVEIAVPLAVFLVGHALICPFTHLFVPIQPLIVLCEVPGVLRRYKSLALRPPELHVLLVALRREVFAVAEADDAAILLVPSPRERPVENRQRELQEVLVARFLCNFHKEPARLDGVAGVDRAANHRVDELAVRPDRFEKRLELGMDEVVLEEPYRLGYLLVEDRVVADVL